MYNIFKYSCLKIIALLLKMDLAMLMKQMDSQMTAPLKRSANLEYIVEGLKAKDARYEHMMPTNYVLMNLVDYYKNDRANADQLADKLFEEYIYAYIKYSLLNGRLGVQEYIVNRARKDKSSLLRNAKIRLSNIHPGRLLMNMRGQDKWLK